MRTSSIKLVSYDLHKPERDYDTLIKAIKDYGNNCKINQSDWLISTTQTCKEIRDNLEKFVDDNDTLFVVELSNNAGWWASYNLKKEAINWLRS